MRWCFHVITIAVLRCRAAPQSVSKCVCLYVCVFSFLLFCVMLHVCLARVSSCCDFPKASTFVYIIVNQNAQIKGYCLIIIISSKSIEIAALSCRTPLKDRKCAPRKNKPLSFVHHNLVWCNQDLNLFNSDWA